jgi:hypothetical protein
MPYIVLDPANAVEIATPVPNPAAPVIGGQVSLVKARQEVLAMLKGRTDVEPERVDFWLNRAYIDIATSAKQDALKASLGFTTVAGNALYLLPGFVTTTLLAARVDPANAFGGVPMEKIDQQSYRQRRNDAGPPVEFFRSDRLLVLWPTPDAEYSITLDYRFEPYPLAQNSHCPVLRPEWLESWIRLAHKKLLAALTEWEASMAAGNDLTSHLRMRQDPETDENENRIIASSVPRTQQQLTRPRGSHGMG